MSENFTSSYAFVHIPKTGGTTIEYLFFNKKKGSNHNGISSYKDHYHKFIFSIVRNPYTRIFSLFWYYKNGGNGTLSDKIKQKNCTTFYDFFQTKYSNLRTQHELLGDEHINYVGRFENFEKEIEYLSRLLKVDCSSKIKLRNTRDNQKKMDFVIEPKMIDLISEKYNIDFQKYGYSKIKLKKNMTLREFTKTYQLK